MLGYVGKRWEQHTVTALDSALNKWVNSVPEHRETLNPPLCLTLFQFFSSLVRWGSEASKKNKTFLVQSAFIWCQFYETQLHVHRMVALGNTTDPERAAASMIICKNAARRCIEIAESANDALAVPLCSYLLMVRLTSPNYVNPSPSCSP